MIKFRREKGKKEGLGAERKVKILVVSDTHGQNRNLETVVNRVKPIDMLIHLGDVEGSEYLVDNIGECPTYIVRGNCDMNGSLPGEIVLPVENHTIFMTHGHRYMVGYGTERLKEAARARNADIVLFGHTHVPYLEQENGMTILNPGSLSRPRQGDHQCSYAMIEIDRDGQFHYTISKLAR